MKIGTLKNFSYIGISKLVATAIRSGFYLIIATLLLPSEYGELGFIVSMAGTASVIARFGLPFSTVVYRAKGEQLMSEQVNLLALITASIASLTLLFINEFSALLCIGMSMFFLFQHNLLGDKKYKRYMINSLIRNGLVFAIPFPLFFVMGVPGIVLGIAIGNIVIAAFIGKYLNFKIVSFHLFKLNYKVLIHNFGIDASRNLVRYIDKVFVGAIFGFSSLGFYYFNLQVLFALELLSRVLYLFLLSEESSGKRHNKLIQLVILSTVGIVVVAIFISPFAIKQFFPQYIDGLFSLQVLVVSLIPITISSILSARMQAEKSTKIGYSAIIRIGSLLISIGILGNLYGLIGMSLSVLISTILNTIFLYYLYRKDSNP